jgi:hypothetical protein
MFEQSLVPSNASANREVTSVFDQLQALLIDYLQSHSHLSLNGLSKRCGVSEPTLRRIRHGQVKTIPNVSTIFTFLTYIFQEKDVERIVSMVGEPLSGFLNDKAANLKSFNRIEYSEDLTEILRDPVKYVIYKIAAGGHGLSAEKVIDLFGSHGEKQLQSLVTCGWMYKENDLYFVKTPNFSLSYDVFVEHFKVMADFIKPEKHANSQSDLAPFFVSQSSSLNKEAYKEIRKIYKKAVMRVSEIVNNPQSFGPIPTFVLSAVDTMDSDCADEISQKKDVSKS